MNPDFVFEELTPISFLRRAAAVFGDRTAVVDGDFECTYRELWLRARQSAGLLASVGIEPGDRVAVLSPNTHLLLEAHYSVPLSGGVLVALNTRLAPTELAYILEHSGSRVLLVDNALRETADTATRLLDAPPTIITADAHEQALPEQALRQMPVTDERSLLSINYTSGTTGRPKGVMYHHRGAYLQALAMALHAKLDVDSRYLWTLPMFHTNGWCFPWAVTAAGGVHHCLPTIDPAAIWDAIDHGVTHFCAAPTVLSMLVQAVPEQQDRVHRVRVFAGGAPPWPSLLRQLTDLGIDVEHLYGLTETFGPAVLSLQQPEWDQLGDEEHAKHVARQGIANVVTEPVRILDAAGNDVPPYAQAQGEIVLRGNNLMLGYYRDPDATAAACTPDGWFRTGDVGVMHPDGYIELKDRMKDVIISGGENITSIEVESALTEHPDILEAAVVAHPDKKWGEVPIAYVSVRTGSTVTPAELIDFARTRIAGFKIPRTIVIGDLPKTSTGKIQKNALRDRATHSKQTW
jgi:fatty-acyl-CoA synthase